MSGKDPIGLESTKSQSAPSPQRPKLALKLKHGLRIGVKGPRAFGFRTLGVPFGVPLRDWFL